MNDLTKTSKSVKIWGWVVLIAGVFALISSSLKPNLNN